MSMRTKHEVITTLSVFLHYDGLCFFTELGNYQGRIIMTLVIITITSYYGEIEELLMA